MLNLGIYNRKDIVKPAGMIDANPPKLEKTPKAIRMLEEGLAVLHKSQR